MYKIDKPFVAFIYGLPCSGKTTLALKLKEIFNDDINHIDGDGIRKILNKDLSYSKKDRIENHKRILEIIKDKDKSVVVSIILPYEQSRILNKKLFKDNYIQIYLDCPLSECERRDIKGMYKKARFGEIVNFTGVNGDFEFSNINDLVINTNGLDTFICTIQLIEFLVDKKFIEEKSTT